MVKLENITETVVEMDEQGKCHSSHQHIFRIDAMEEQTFTDYKPN